jgi:DNA primase
MARRAPPMPVKQTVVARYEYRDESGVLRYFKERIEPGPDGRGKEFKFYHGKRFLGRGGESLLYNLQDVLRSKAVIITEGEKQADIVKSWGLCGTSLDSGAGSKLTPTMVGHLTDKRIAILQDNDEPGTLYALKLANGLQGKFESLRIVLLPDLPPKGDICDWAGDKPQLLKIIKATPEWVPPPEVNKPDRRKRTKTAGGDITDEMIEVAAQFPIDELLDFSHGKVLCFSHKEKTPSMSKFKNKCHCHACGFTGSTIDVLMVRDGLSFVDAVKELAGR